MADSSHRLPVRMAAVAWLWGLAEATLFFIVPDVLLSVLALRRPWAQVWRACLWALAGALLGGVLMYVWAARAESSALAMLQQIPAISAAMCDAVARQLHEQGALALFIGPLTGTPYKIYAAQSGAQGASLLVFLAISVPARLLRFLIVAGLVRLLCERLPGLSLRWRVAVWALAWGGFYAWYFWEFS
ncbi:hypothetical protein Q9Q94_10460 [Uliginosibacterium sp. 31-16]|uniref:hypothetical protein n=1 Tax=Uliginosibacterium sp. 31-16 TaxID=3068315 RepID=UPI00273F530E|nr:hypothetical protein [Uliginosibacterium sp. 31-16]MDP5239958.1 hypothetical protein [Uliginosibacterium sp. 31-16]